MTIQTPKRITVDEYLIWAERHPGRYELINGVVREMSPETSGHADAKAAAFMALRSAIKRAGLAASAKPDGMTVRISKHVSFEPDALVYLAPKVDRNNVEIQNPIIIVEVGSPSTRGYDTGFKLPHYMTLPSVEHVLLVNADEKFIVHHKRAVGGGVHSETVSEGILRLDPPGLEIPVAEFFAVD